MLKQIAVAALSSLLISCTTPKQKYKVEYMGEPCLIPVASGQWKLCDNMIVRIDDSYHVVPMGFKTDLASIPRAIWWLYAPTDFKAISSSVLHDWHYCCSKDSDRMQSDDQFYYGLISQGMPKARASLYYSAVRLFGWPSFDNEKGIEKHKNEFDKDELQGIYDDVNAELG